MGRVKNAKNNIRKLQESSKYGKTEHKTEQCNVKRGADRSNCHTAH